MVAIKQNPPATFGAPPALVSGEVAISLPQRHGTEYSVTIEQRDPLPATVLALTTWISVG
jgi:hypothetical protein